MNFRHFFTIEDIECVSNNLNSGFQKLEFFKTYLQFFQKVPLGHIEDLHQSNHFDVYLLYKQCQPCTSGTFLYIHLSLNNFCLKNYILKREKNRIYPICLEAKKS